MKYKDAQILIKRKRDKHLDQNLFRFSFCRYTGFVNEGMLLIIIAPCNFRISFVFRYD